MKHIEIFLTLILIYTNLVKSYRNINIAQTPHSFEANNVFSFNTAFTVISLYNNDHTDDFIKEYTNSIISKIKEYQISRIIANYIHECTSTLSKLNKNTCSSFNIILVIWNELVFQKFVKQCEISFNGHNFYLIYFIESTPNYCLKGNSYFENILMNLWHKLHLLNVVVNAPFSCKPHIAYLYRPFTKAQNKKWGVIDTLEMNETIYYVRNTVKNMHGYTLNVSTFIRWPTAVKDLPKYMYDGIYRDRHKINGIAGVDGCVLINFAKHLNFTPNIIYPFDGNNFGYNHTNYVSGSLGDIVSGRAQLAANSRLLTYYGTDMIEYTVPYDSDSICFVVPKSKRVPQWRSIFRCFQFQSWITIFGIMTFCMLFWCCFKKTVGCGDYSKSILQIYGLFIGNSIRIRPKCGQYMFLTGCTMVEF